MHRPSRCWLGLPFLAALLLLALWIKLDAVQTDVARNAQAALAANKTIDPLVSVAGRDVRVAGLALTDAARGDALAAADAARGVRLVEGDVRALPTQKPYSLSLTRAGGGVVVNGYVPNPDARAALMKAIAAVAPNPRDELAYASGAPANFDAAAVAALAAVAPLKSGAASLTDGALTVVGEAADLAAYDKAVAATRALPAGVTLARFDVAPPKVAPYVFSARRDGPALALSGFAPDAATQGRLLGAAQTLAPMVSGGLALGSGAPAGYEAMAKVALAALAPLQKGAATLTDGSLTVTGEAATPVALAAAQAAAKALPAGMTLARFDVAAPRPVPAPVPVPAPAKTSPERVAPFVFEARRTPSDVILTGHAPDADAKARLAEEAGKIGLKVDDKLAVGAGAPDGFEAMAKAALGALGKMRQGDVALSDGKLSVSGRIADVASRDALVAWLRGLGLPGFSIDEMDVFAPRRALNDIELVCQDKLLDGLARRTVEFETGSARVSAKSAELIAAMAETVKACPNVDLEVAGFTDNVGDPARNIDLSRARAQAVVKALVGAGAPTEHLSPEGYGDARPIASNDTPEGRARNRRIEFSVK